MGRSPRPGAPMGSPEWKERVSRGTRRGLKLRRERKRVRPRDLDRLRNDGEVAEALRPLLEIAEQEAAELFASLGGFDAVSAQRRLLLEDVIALGIALRGQLAVYLRTEDPDAAARVGTLSGSRRSSLVALGLERLEREVPSLEQYLREKEAQTASETHESDASEENSITPDSSALEAEQAATRPNGGSAPERDVVHLDSAAASTTTSTTDQED